MMNDRKDTVRDYKERTKPAGVFQIRNLRTGKRLLCSSTNLEGPLNRMKFMLTTGSHKNKALQGDWNALGPEHFTFEILEELDQEKIEDSVQLNRALKILEEKWMKGMDTNKNEYYNVGTNIRLT